MHFSRTKQDEPSSGQSAPQMISCPGDSIIGITRCHSGTGMPEVAKNPTDRGVIVCISMMPLALGSYQMWLQGKAVPLPYIPGYRTNVIDVESEPSCWIGSAFDYVHYHVPQRQLDDIAEDLSFSRIAGYRFAISEDDLVVAQMTKTLLPYTGPAGWPSSLALDQFNLILGAHILQKYAITQRINTVSKGGLAPWQMRRATELLRERLDGRVRLSELAKECNLSVSHFARSFKTSLGISSHQWLIRQRIEFAKELLARSQVPLVDIAVRSGFADQAAFTRTFHHSIGVSPGRWRRDHQRR